MKKEGKSLRDEIMELCVKEYGSVLERPWPKYPGHVVLRHQDNGKWYALFMEVERCKLGLQGEGVAEILNVKADPEMVGLIAGTPGYFPAYHMNKAHWLTVLLDGTADRENILSLLEKSFALTGSKKSGAAQRRKKDDVRKTVE